MVNASFGILAYFSHKSPASLGREIFTPRLAVVQAVSRRALLNQNCVQTNAKYPYGPPPSPSIVRPFLCSALLWVSPCSCPCALNKVVAGRKHFNKLPVISCWQQQEKVQLKCIRGEWRWERRKEISMGISWRATEAALGTRRTQKRAKTKRDSFP